MKRFLAAVCFLVVGVVKNFAQPCTFTVNAGPDTTICANQSANLHGTVTPAAGAYSYSWAPTTTLTNPTTLTPTASPLVNTTYILSVTLGGCTAVDSMHVIVSGQALVLFATDSPTTPICPGQFIQLKAGIQPTLCGVGPACAGTTVSQVIGSGTAAQGGTQLTPPTLMGNYVQSGRNQMLYTAAELTAALGSACTLDGIGFNIAIFNSNAYLQSFTISIACTNLTSLTTFENNNLVQVVAPFNEQPGMGWNDFAFGTPYNWDGVSNLIVDVCWYDPNLFGNQNNKAEVTATNPPGNMTLLYAFGTTDLCGTTAAPTASNLRPNARFGYCQPNINNYPILWSPSTGADSVSVDHIYNPTTHPIISQTYTVNVTNGTCVSSKSVSVTVDNSTVSAGPDISSCPGSAVNLTATLGGTIVPGPPLYTWTTLAGGAVGTGATVTVHPTVNTTYVVAMSGGACVKTDTVNVTLGSLNIDTTVTNVTCFGLHTGTIVITPSNGTLPYTYTWGAGVAGNSNTASGLITGTYQVTVDDANSCSGTATVYVSQPNALSNSGGITITQLKCSGAQTGSISISPTGGTRPYTYVWTNALPPDSSQSNLGAATYTVTTTDANGCSVSTAITISAPPPITFGTAVIQGDKCPNSTTGKITVTPTGGTGAYTYKWNPNTATTTATAQNLTAGTYTVTVTDANQCTASSSNTVSPAITVTFNAPTITYPKCFGLTGSATVNPAGGAPPYSYLWSPSGQTTQTATNLTAQTYTVSVTDDSLCITTTPVIVTQPGAIVIVADSVNVLCNNGATGSISITATTNAANPVTYAWGASAGNATTANITNLAVNTYSVTVQDANGCQQNRTFNITQPPAISITLNNQTEDVCLNGTTGSISLSVTGGTGTLNYAWSNTATTASIGNLPAGTYTLTVTDANSCTATAQYIITQPANGPVFGAPTVTEVVCFGGATGSITVNVTGGTPGYTYAWSTNAPQVNNPAATGLIAGTYSVTATDAGGCSVASGSIPVTQGTQISFGNSTVDSVSCNGGNNGSALITPSGGTGGNYTYTWNGTAGTNPQGGLTANSYTVVVTDGNGCTASTMVVVGQPAPILDSIVRQNVRCHGGDDGSLTVYGYGGNPPFSYRWGDGSTTQLDSLLAIGFYNVTITDSKLCTTSDTASLTQPPVLSFTHTETQITCPGLEDGTITAVGSGGTPPYNFSVTKDFTNFVTTTNGVASQLDSGLYTIILTDNNGCPLTDTAYIKSPVPDIFDVSVDSTSCYGPQYTDGSIYVTPLQANNMPYTYTIDNGPVQDTSYFGNLAAGPHQIIATNQFGCTHDIDTVVSQPGEAYASVLPGDTTIQLGQSVILTSGFGPFSLSSVTSYNWVPSVGLSCVDCPNPMATPYSHVTEYVLTVTYNGLCTASDSMQLIVQNKAQPFIPNSFSPNGDGNNDVFEIYGENIKTVKLRVFNRWGELVFESTNQFNGWDGTYKGVLQNPGVYTYDAEIIFLDDSQVEKHGSITLLR